MKDEQDLNDSQYNEKLKLEAEHQSTQLKDTPPKVWKESKKTARRIIKSQRERNAACPKIRLHRRITFRNTLKSLKKGKLPF
eukprot:g38216.t1